MTDCYLGHLDITWEGVTGRPPPGIIPEFSAWGFPRGVTQGMVLIECNLRQWLGIIWRLLLWGKQGVYCQTIAWKRGPDEGVF